jgi:lysophospholipase L1-like esterase
MRRAVLLAGLLLASPVLAQDATPTKIVIAGDSTAANYPASRYPQTGWGMMLGCALEPGVAVDNQAVGGRSTKSYIDEGRLDRLLAGLKPGDTVLIQFAHNDANRQKPERFVEARGAYRDNLLRFIWQIRGAGGVPVLVTPVARRSFADGQAKADFAEYSAVVRELATTTATPLIDLEALSRGLLDRTGFDASKRYYLHYTPKDGVAAFPEGIADDTHFSELGARRMADLVAGGLARLSLPVSASVRAKRPELTRGKPLGSSACR